MKQICSHILLSALTALAVWASGTSAVCAQILNGGFETGDLSGWTQRGFLSKSSPTVGGPQYSTFAAAQATGTAQPLAPFFSGVEPSQTTTFDSAGVISPAVLPTSGSALAFISNEKSSGNNTLTGSSLSQTFTIPSGVTTLTADLMLLNNDDPKNFVAYNDFGGVVLLQGSVAVAQFNMDLSSASTADVHISADINKGGFYNSTPWQSVSFNVASYAGQTLTLVAYSLNYGGDNLGETRLLIDNVQLLPVSAAFPSASAALQPVPTLSQWTLTFLGLLVALSGGFFLRRHRA
jgi:hypothetical protein